MVVFVLAVTPDNYADKNLVKLSESELEENFPKGEHTIGDAQNGMTMDKLIYNTWIRKIRAPISKTKMLKLQPHRCTIENRCRHNCTSFIIMIYRLSMCIVLSISSYVMCTWNTIHNNRPCYYYHISEYTQRNSSIIYLKCLATESLRFSTDDTY